MDLTIKLMNQYLADINLLYRKVQNFHWNVKGPNFFLIHQKTEEYYTALNLQIDDVAELILKMQGQPIGTMRGYLEITKIKEANDQKIAGELVLESLFADFNYAMNLAKEVKAQAELDSADIIIAYMDDVIAAYYEWLWMLRQSTEV